MCVYIYTYNLTLVKGKHIKFIHMCVGMVEEAYTTGHITG